MILSKPRMWTGLAVAVCATAFTLPTFAQNVAVVNGTAIPSARADAQSRLCRNKARPIRNNCARLFAKN
jgi:peptidyl-prolyl cis-trans isomerase C